jgi:hypothetical protein
LAIAKKDIVGAKLGDINDDLASRAASYGSAVKKFVAKGDDSVPSSMELSALKPLSTKTLDSFKKASASCTKAKGHAYIKKAMLLQTGQ